MAADSSSASASASPPVRTQMTLYLGVIDQPYRSRGKGVRSITTGDVAKILEGGARGASISKSGAFSAFSLSGYGLFSVFARVKKDEIRQALIDSAQGSLEAMLMGQHVEPFARGLSQIRTMFQQFIRTREVERVGILGVPTKAALRGVNHRLAHPYAKANPRRGSFDDTGLLVTSFIPWIE